METTDTRHDPRDQRGDDSPTRLPVSDRQAIRARCRSPWLTVREAERYCGVRHGTIGRAIAAGEIRCFRRGRVTLVRARDVDGWIERFWDSLPTEGALEEG